MEKSSMFNKIILSLCLIALLVNVVEINQIRIQTKLTKEETIAQKFMNNFPVKIKLLQGYTNKNNVQFVIKDKYLSDKISAPVSVQSYDYWTGKYTTNTKSYTPKSDSNKLVYVNANIKNLSVKKLIWII